MFSADPQGALDAALPAMAALLAERLPPGDRLLPHLAAGAYRELERRGLPQQATQPKNPRAWARSAATRLRRAR